jgi:hypothetical protein
MNTEANESLPTDDIPAESTNGPTEQELLDAVLEQSQFIEESLPDEEIPEVDPSESDEEDPEESDEVVNGDEEEVEYEEDGEEDEDATATQEATVYTLEDLDLDAQVIVKIDGEEVPVSFSDLVKGYSTEQSLSNKGRELGEARKELEAEREAQLAEINKIGQASAAVLLSEEQTYAKQYHDLEAKISEARNNGDTYELSELKDQREQAQQGYWNARKKREGIIAQMEEQQSAVYEKQWVEALDYFNTSITEYIPEFDENVAGEIRQFALEEGIPEEFIDTVVDPVMVKFVNDYRLLKQGVSKGEAKRKSAPAKKLPVKKAKSATKKKTDQEAMIKARAFKEDANPDDQMAFLRQLASRSLG